MLEMWMSTICGYAHHAHWIIFCLLILAGFNLPISEDIMLLTGGALAATCIPEHTFYLFAWIYAGCWISAWIPYWIGRHFGPKLYEIRWFKNVITKPRIDRLHHYYEKFGVFTFIVGRFIPGGVRNALFLTSGLGKMPFLTFVIRDGFACFISSMTLFTIGYKFAKNYHEITHFFRVYDLVVIGIIVVLIAALIGQYYYRRRNHVDIT